MASSLQIISRQATQQAQITVQRLYSARSHDSLRAEQLQCRQFLVEMNRTENYNLNLKVLSTSQGLEVRLSSF